MPRKFHGLKKPKVRQDWNKYNLYNLSRLTVPPAANKTFFQQKWLAKSMTRAYHGPHIREGQWTRMFDRRLPAVVPMDFRQLAKSDGSEFAMGRGSGLELDPRATQGKRGAAAIVAKTPYMHMAYHPIERRLDTAIWRALFASSTKQARQFVVHGFVRVNGKKMIYPGYLLNPGDMFSVDPERVLFATGARKIRKGSAESSQEMSRSDDGLDRRLAAEEEEEDFDDREVDDSSEAGAATIESDEDREAAAKEPEDQEDAREALKSLMARAKRILNDSKGSLSGKRQQELRAFSQSVKKTLSRHRGDKETSTPNEDSVDDLETALAQITSRIPSDAAQAAPAALTTDATTTTTSSNPQMQDPEKVDQYRARKDAELLHAAIARANINPIDVRKPYATPWKPREFMSAFAFIPRYLEVNQNICSAVYVRHPVARPGLAEVPTPFHGETMALAFNWYLRRR